MNKNAKFDIIILGDNMIKIMCDKCKYEFSIFKKECPNCGDKVKITSKFFCNDCGNEIDLDEKKCKHCDKIPEQVIVRSKSGKEILTDFETSDETTMSNVEEYSSTDENTKESIKATKKNSDDIDNYSENEQLENIIIGKKYKEIRNNNFSIDILIFGVLHVFYKKVYSWGFLWLLAICISNMINLFGITLFILNIYLAFSGRKIYLKYVERKVSKIKKENQEKSFEELKQICEKAGKESILSMIFCLLIIIVFIGIGIYIKHYF